MLSWANGWPARRGKPTVKTSTSSNWPTTSAPPPSSSRKWAASRALGGPRERAEALSLRGMTRLWSGDAEGAERQIREALEVFRAEGDGRQEAWALWNLAWIAFDQGRFDIAEGRLEKSTHAFAE